MKNSKAKKFIDHNGNVAVLVPEDEYRKRILNECRFKFGEASVVEMKRIFDKYDTLLKNCGNEQERKAIGTMGVLEISSALDGFNTGIGGSLIIDGKTVIQNGKKL